MLDSSNVYLNNSNSLKTFIPNNMHAPRDSYMHALKRIIRYLQGDNFISWSSKRQPTLSRSCAEAKYRGVTNVVSDSCWIQMDSHFVREKVARGEVRDLHVPSRYQIADIFTKGLPRVLFDDFRDSLSVRPPPAAGGRGRSVSTHSESGYQGSRLRKAKPESKDSEGGHWKSKSRKQKSSIEEEDPSQPWTCEEADPFTPRIRYFDLPKKNRMPNNIKTYDRSDDPEDHLKIFQAAANVKRWPMLTWCHMFNSTLTGSARDPVEIHYIKQREGESTEDFMQRFKAESKHVKGAPECMRISVFMDGITNPELIKRLYDNISKSVDEMMRITTTFLRPEVVASNQARKKAPLAWK
nr:reverse transcriptase domain-containing protein [Tanacetum cinerariifolium]